MSESLEERVSALVLSLGKTVEGLSLAYSSLRKNPTDSLIKCRIVLERVLKELYAANEWTLPKIFEIGFVLYRDEEKRVRHISPPLVFAKMGCLNGLASAAGAHDYFPLNAYTSKEYSPEKEDAERALEMLCDVLEWFDSDFLLSGLVDNFGREIAKSDKLVLYLSGGGTCRCAMANMTTRQLLESRYKGKVKGIVPMSAAFHAKTLPIMSEPAVQVLSERFGKFDKTHNSIQSNERYFRRADLILAMDKKLLDSLAERFKDKAFLFRKFYGDQGDVSDPYGGGKEAYRRCFNIIYDCISSGLGTLLMKFGIQPREV